MDGDERGASPERLADRPPQGGGRPRGPSTPTTTAPSPPAAAGAALTTAPGQVAWWSAWSLTHRPAPKPFPGTQSCCDVNPAADAGVNPGKDRLDERVGGPKTGIEMADKIRARAAVVIAAATVSLAVGNASLGAQPGEPPDLPMSISPTSGPIGTVIVISGEECFAPDGSGGHHVWLAGVEDQGDYMPLETTTPVDADGTWEYRFTLAADPPSIETLSIYGSCNDTEHTVSGHYPSVLFDVVHPPSTDPPPTTPAPTTPPPTTPATGPEAPAPDTGAPGPPATTPRAPAASPVLDQPTYTG